MKTKIAIAAVTLCLVVGGGCLGVSKWKQVVKVRNVKQAIATARVLKGDGKAGEALVFLETHITDQKLSKTLEAEIETLELELIVASRNFAKLQAIFVSTPNRVLENEGAALLRARQLIYEDNLEALASILKKWKTRSKDPEWHYMELTYTTKKKQDAKFSEMADVPVTPEENDGNDARVHLYEAVLNGGQDDKVAWEHLVKAYEIDPRNWETRTFMGNILEKRGLLERAQVEYVAAYLIQPENPLTLDNLASFYTRNGRIGSALRTWTGGKAESLPAFVWIKADFWSRVFERPETMPGVYLKGNSAEMAQLCLDLPETHYWSEQAENKLRVMGNIENYRAYVFWLKVIHHLKIGDFEEAKSLMHYTSVADQSLNPNLYSAMKYLVDIQVAEEGETIELPYFSSKSALSLHPFFVELKEGTADPKFRAGPEAFAAAFFAGGWIRAGINLLPASYSKDRPQWFDYTVAKSLWRQRGAEAALTFLKSASGDVELDLLRGELLVATGDREKGLKFLESIRQSNSAAGERAAWLCVLDAVESEKYDLADQIVAQQARFKESLSGTELRAQIAIARGDNESARTLLTTIHKESELARRLLKGIEEDEAG